jgi:hypothetical protein
VSASLTPACLSVVTNAVPARAAAHLLRRLQTLTMATTIRTRQTFLFLSQNFLLFFRYW